MGRVTHKNLYKLVQDQIDRSSEYENTKRFRNQLDRAEVAPFTPNAISDIRAGDLITTVQDLLADALPGFIIEGLDVTQTDPISGSVIISAGKGSKGGHLFTLAADTTVPIPFTPTQSVFFISLFRNRIIVEKNQRSDALTLAKIVVTKPGTTNKVINHKDEIDNSWQAYIQNFREYKLHGDANGRFEEETVELLRDNIGPVLADNMIGNIRLSEDLKITNTHGTLELDSESVKVYNGSGIKSAEFNRNGTFYFDSNGVALAHFSTDSARIGNISITKNSVQSSNFISENRGFKIQDDGYAEFDNVRVRGRLSSSVFEHDRISAVGGKLFVGNSTVIASDMTALDASTLVVEDALFNIGDILRIKDGVDEEYMEVTNDASEPTYTVTRDLAAQYSADSNPAWSAGTAIVAIGNANSGENPGFIQIDAVSNFSPFIDIAERQSSTYNDYITKLRLGNLEGISDNQFHSSGGNLTGYGLYSDNVYLKGQLRASVICGGSLEAADICATNIYTSCLDGANCITGSCIRTANTGQRLAMDSTGLYAYNAAGTNVMKLQGTCICFIDPACTECYSFLDAGALKFHHPWGDIPYIRRFDSGTGASGATVCLYQWFNQPEVIVSVNSLQSFDAANSGSDQQWCVFFDNLQTYSNSASDFGWKFDLHSKLTVTGGVQPECVRNLAFATTAITVTNVCCSLFKMKFQLWCNNAAPSTFCYGCLCYCIQFRCCDGLGGAYTCCAYTYTQPNATQGQMQTTETVCHSIFYGATCCWQIQATQTSLTWFDSGIDSGGCTPNTWSCTATEIGCLPRVRSGFSDASCCQCHLATTSFGSAPAADADIFCQCVCYCLSTFVCVTDGNCACLKDHGPGGGLNVCIVCVGPPSGTCCLYCQQFNITPQTNCFCGTFQFCLLTWDKPAVAGVATIWNCFKDSVCYYHCIHNTHQTVCYYTYSGAAASCTFKEIYSTTETTDTEVILDAAGNINWLAVAFV